MGRRKRRKTRSHIQTAYNSRYIHVHFIEPHRGTRSGLSASTSGHSSLWKELQVPQTVDPVSLGTFWNLTTTFPSDCQKSSPGLAAPSYLVTSLTDLNAGEETIVSGSATHMNISWVLCKAWCKLVGNQYSTPA